MTEEIKSQEIARSQNMAIFFDHIKWNRKDLYDAFHDNNQGPNYYPLYEINWVSYFEGKREQTIRLKDSLLQEWWIVDSEDERDISLHYKDKKVILRNEEKSIDSAWNINPRIEKRFIAIDDEQRKVELVNFVHDLWFSSKDVVVRVCNVDRLPQVRESATDRYSTNWDTRINNRDFNHLNDYLKNNKDPKTWKPYSIEDGMYGYSRIEYPEDWLSNTEKRKMAFLIYRRSHLVSIGDPIWVFRNTDEKKQALIGVIYSWYNHGEIEKWYYQCNNDNEREKYIKNTIYELKSTNHIHRIGRELKNIIHDLTILRKYNNELLKKYHSCIYYYINIEYLLSDIRNWLETENANGNDMFKRTNKLKEYMLDKYGFLNMMPNMIQELKSKLEVVEKAIKEYNKQ